MYKQFFLSVTVVCFAFFAATAGDSIHIYPTHWWTGMKTGKLQLMIHSGSDLPPVVSVSYAGVKIRKTYQPKNKHYLFIDLLIASSAKPGKFAISFAGGGSFTYELRSRNRENQTGRNQGVHSDDFIYLLMPDRFSNGDSTNDRFMDMRDTITDRNNSFARHGGDLKGVQQHLDYFSELGVTALWLMPVIENNMSPMPEWNTQVSGYHGYWFTDHYEVDKRLGGNNAYHELIDAAHGRGLKIIQDAVYNHVGLQHWFIQDLPMDDWINQWPVYQAPNHREEVLTDPYAAPADKKIMLEGWFVPHLPDLNLTNPYLANFLIQHAIWTTEEFGIDGWRVDTYKYCDEQFLNRINTALITEFPRITIFGEAWTNSVVASAYFTQNNINSDISFKHNLQGVTDFPLCFAMLAAINQPNGWTEGLNKLYMTLSQDLLYKDPMRNCIFLDNHDMDRVFSVLGEDAVKLKSALGLLLTLRGIPQLYYGTEILMKNFKNPSDAEVRRDFPGGWPDDRENKFLEAGRNEKENEMFNYVKTLAGFRMHASALKTGNLMQYIPADGVYVYFRYDSSQTIMCILNRNEETKILPTGRFEERTRGFASARNVIDGKQTAIADISVPPKTLLVLELQKKQD